MSAPDRLLPRSRARQTPGLHRLGLLGQARALVRRSRRPHADSGPRARGPWRQPHRTHVHRRPLRRLALSRPARHRLRLAAREPLARRWTRSSTTRASSPSAHCAPPDNKPTPEELRNCRPWLEAELDLFPDLRVVVALGRIAFDIYLSILKDRGLIARRARLPVRTPSRASPGRGSAGPDQFLSPQPAEHLDRQADRRDADACFRPGPPSFWHKIQT